MKQVSLLLACLAVSACATYAEPTGPTEPRLYPAQTTQFDPSEIAWFNQPGNNTIQGNAVLRTVGGEVRTCAGLQAQLAPVSTYGSERIRTIYKNDERGYVQALDLMEFPSTDPAFSASIRTTTCDSQGNFIFERLPDGEYYVNATVTWGVPQVGYYSSYTSTEGGILMQRVRVSGGETRRIVLSNQ
jgi:hypothetical protein